MTAGAGEIAMKEEVVNGSAIEEWRRYVARHKLKVAIIAGLVSTHITTNLGMWYHGLGLPDLNFDLLNGYLVFGNAANAFGKDGFQDPAILTLFGAAVHYGQGVAFALVFAFGIGPLIPIAGTVVGNIVKALIWGAILATLSALWWVPALFPNLAGPGVGAGLFFSNFGPDQLKWIIALYLWHFVYGLNLGLFYNPAPGVIMEGAEA